MERVYTCTYASNEERERERKRKSLVVPVLTFDGSGVCRSACHSGRIRHEYLYMYNTTTTMAIIKYFDPGIIRAIFVIGGYLACVRLWMRLGKNIAISMLRSWLNSATSSMIETIRQSPKSHHYKKLSPRYYYFEVEQINGLCGTL